MTAGRTIVVPVDMSIFSQYAVEWTMENLTQDGDMIILFHAYQLQDMGGDSTEAFSEKAYGDQIMKWLTASAKAPEGVKTEVELRRNGSAGEAICTFLGDVKPSQVVVGTRGRSGMAKWVLGSVAEYLVKHASVPVTVVRTPQEYIQRNGNRAAAHMLQEGSVFNAVSSNVY